MKKNRRVCIGFAVLVTAALFIFAGCDSGTGGGGGSGGGDVTFIIKNTTSAEVITGVRIVNGEEQFFVGDDVYSDNPAWFGAASISPGATQKFGPFKLESTSSSQEQYDLGVTVVRGSGLWALWIGNWFGEKPPSTITIEYRGGSTMDDI